MSLLLSLNSLSITPSPSSVTDGGSGETVTYTATLTLEEVDFTNDYSYTWSVTSLDFQIFENLY
jgi:hypothetical protein